MTPTRWSLTLVLAAVTAACTDRDPVAAPTGPAAGSPGATVAASELPRMENTARRLALALRNPAFRTYLKRRLDGSPFPEHKIHFQRFLREPDHRALQAMAGGSGESESTIATDAEGTAPLEMYLPWPEHRARWDGGEQLLVATAVGDRDIPVAYDLQGGRHFLDPGRPPQTPVLAVVPVETDFDHPGAPVGTTCNPDLGSCGGSGGGSNPPPPPPPGLYMTYSHFNDTFEGWLKGDPEFEIHMLGQSGASDSLVSYQCAGEHAGGPYAFDQNGISWAGSVMLFSQAQFDSYRAQHPGQSLRVFALEDDDGACQIKMDGDEVTRLFQGANAAYGIFTAGRDSTSKLGKTFDKAIALINFFKALWSIILTKDDLVGTAIQDSVVGWYYPGANWIVKGPSNVTNGWMKLEMK